jgi:Na+/glutamate symporter
LPEVFIVLLISAAVVIFVFWISTQFLGAATFQNLPPWLTAVFKNVWAAVGAGATGIGLALLKAFTSRGQPQPNYCKYISFSVSGFLLIILVLVRIGSPKPVGPYPPPPNTSAIDYNKSAPVEFDP